MRRILPLLIAAALLALAAGGFWLAGLRNARAMPIVREARIALSGWPAGQRPLRLLLLSDIHIGNPAMDEARLASLVAALNGLHPDLFLIAGDFVSGATDVRIVERSTALASILAGLRAPLGTIAVPGNHDIASGWPAIAAALRGAGITVLSNEVARRGPLAIAGGSDAFSHHENMAALNAALATTPGTPILLDHSPDIAPKAVVIRLVLAGHTHCGQIWLPPLPVPHFSRYGLRYRCGLIREGSRTTIVSAGLGADDALPLRFGAPPDVWLITVGPAR